MNGHVEVVRRAPMHRSVVTDSQSVSLKQLSSSFRVVLLIAGAAGVLIRSG